MRNYQFYKEMFMPGEIYTGTVIEKNCYKLSVQLAGGAFGVVYTDNINGENHKFDIGKEYDFEVIGFNSDGLLSLVLPREFRALLQIHPEESKATVVATSHTAVAFYVNGDIFLYKTALGETFFELMEPGSEASVILYCPDGDGKNLELADITEFSTGDKKIKLLDETCRHLLKEGQKESVNGLFVGQLVELTYDPLTETFFLPESCNPVVIEKRFFLNNDPYIKHLGRIMSFNEDDIPCAELIQSWK